MKARNHMLLDFLHLSRIGLPDGRYFIANLVEAGILKINA